MSDAVQTLQRTMEGATGMTIREMRTTRGAPPDGERRIKVLAPRTGIDERTWRRVEKGESYSRDTIRAIAKVLGTTVADLEPQLETTGPVSQLDRIEAMLARVLELVSRAAAQLDPLDRQQEAAVRELEVAAEQLASPRRTREGDADGPEAEDQAS